MIDHRALMDRVRGRVGDKRVLALVKAFLRAGILSEDGLAGTRVPAHPKAGSLAAAGQHRLVGLDEYFADAGGRPVPPPTSGKRRRGGCRSTGSSAMQTIRGAGRRTKRTRGPAGNGGAVLARWAAPVGGQDEVCHMTRARLPRVPHPAETETRHGKRVVYTSVEEGAGLDRRARPLLTADRRSGAAPAAPAQSGAAGLVHLLPYGVSKHLRLSR